MALTMDIPYIRSTQVSDDITYAEHGVLARSFFAGNKHSQLVACRIVLNDIGTAMPVSLSMHQSPYLENASRY